MHCALQYLFADFLEVIFCPAENIANIRKSDLMFLSG